MSNVPRPPRRGTTLRKVLDSAARLQRQVPDAVLVGGAAAALHAGHRESFDHGHVLPDLQERYAQVLDAVEATDGWATSVRASRPPMTIMGSLGGVEAGLRQMRRTRPLETIEVDLGSSGTVTAPTLDEMLRVKAYLVVQRNAVRDYLDVVALADRMGQDRASEVLVGMDDYYDDRSGEHGSVLTSLVLRLANPQPMDSRVTRELPRYRGLDERWHDWGDVTLALGELSLRLGGAA